MSQVFDEFWKLYWGELAIVESDAVQTAMVHFGEDLREWQRLGKNAPAPPDLKVSLKKKAQDLRVAAGQAL